MTNNKSFSTYNIIFLKFDTYINMFHQRFKLRRLHFQVNQQKTKSIFLLCLINNVGDFSLLGLLGFT